MATTNAGVEDKSYFQRFCDYMSRDTKGVEIATYTISGVLFVVAYNKIRPITRFAKASDIPRHFIREQIPQYGRVRKVEPSIQSGPLLIVRHQPPLNIFFWSSKTLPVKVAGIDVNANGYSWLQSVVVDRQITFLPVASGSGTGQDHAECRVFFYDRSKDGKSVRRVDVGEALLSLGFARMSVPVPVKTKAVAAAVSKDPFERAVQGYLRALERSEREAKDRRVGLWQQSLPPKLWPAKLWQSTWDGLLLKISPPSRRLPELVR